MRRPYLRRAVLRPTPEAVEMLLGVFDKRNGECPVHEISKATVENMLDRNDVLAAALTLRVRVTGKGGETFWALPAEVKR